MLRRHSLLAFAGLLFACSNPEAASVGGTGAASDAVMSQSAPASPSVMTAPAMHDGAETRQAFDGKQSIVAQRVRAPEEPAFSAQGPDDLLAQSMIVRTGSASIRVDSLALGMARVRELARRVGGYVGNTSVQSEGGSAPSATLEVRVPSARFDEAIAGIETIGLTENVHVSAEDVGEQYVDLSARLSNSQKLETRLIALLANRTGRLSDVVQLEEKLSQVRGEIERVEGRMRWLRSRASVSTISVTVHEPFPVVGPSGTPRELVEAFRRAWRNFVMLIAGLIAASGVLVPVGGAAVAGWMLWRRRYRRPPPSVPEPSAA